MLPSHLHTPLVVLSIAFAFLTGTPLAPPVRAAWSPPPAQSPPQPPGANTTAAKPVTPSTLPKDYVIGVQDILNVVFWNAKELSADVIVRPDGKISLPLLNDVEAAGMTPEQLGAAIAKGAAKFVRDPGATVIVKAINSRKVYVVGEVTRPGSFPLGSEMTVLQAIGEAGGFLEGAKKGDVVIVRHENGKERRYKFNYNDFVKGKNILQNILLLPGDTILVR
jgi:polysaccharide biosynthesis/export protein